MKALILSAIVALAGMSFAPVASAQPATIEGQIEHCRNFGHRDRSCETLCYGQGITEACEILEAREDDRRTNQQNLIIEEIVRGIVSGIVQGTEGSNSEED